MSESGSRCRSEVKGIMTTTFGMHHVCGDKVPDACRISDGASCLPFRDCQLIFFHATPSHFSSTTTRSTHESRTAPHYQSTPRNQRKWIRHSNFSRFLGSSSRMARASWPGAASVRPPEMSGRGDGCAFGQRYPSSHLLTVWTIADRREFLRISQAVGMGFLIMGVIGYIVKLSASR